MGTANEAGRLLLVLQPHRLQALRLSKMSVTISEADVQATIVEGLRALGYHVEITARQRRACSHCHKFSHRGDGSSKGLADLMIGRESWGWMRMDLEVKGSETPLSPEQRELFDRGLIEVARSWEDAVAAVAMFEHRNGLQRVADRVS